MDNQSIIELDGKFVNLSDLPQEKQIEIKSTICNNISKYLKSYYSSHPCNIQNGKKSSH